MTDHDIEQIRVLIREELHAEFDRRFHDINVLMHDTRREHEEMLRQQLIANSTLHGALATLNGTLISIGGRLEAMSGRMDDFDLRLAERGKLTANVRQPPAQ